MIIQETVEDITISLGRAVAGSVGWMHKYLFFCAVPIFGHIYENMQIFSGVLEDMSALILLLR